MFPLHTWLSCFLIWPESSNLGCGVVCFFVFDPKLVILQPSSPQCGLISAGKHCLQATDIASPVDLDPPYGTCIPMSPISIPCRLICIPTSCVVREGLGATEEREAAVERYCEQPVLGRGCKTVGGSFSPSLGLSSLSKCRMGTM